jgi:hypothetical protein
VTGPSRIPDDTARVVGVVTQVHAIVDAGLGAVQVVPAGPGGADGEPLGTQPQVRAQSRVARSGTAEFHAIL